MAGLTDTEDRLLEEVSMQALMRDAAALARWERVAGTRGERDSVAFICQRLEQDGLATKVHEFESLLGWPESARLEVLTPRPCAIRALSHSFAPSTHAQGLEGEFAYLGDGVEGDYAGRVVTGKFVLTKGMPSPLKVLIAQDRGAAGLIGVSQRLHDLCVSPVWGTPTTKTAAYLPRIPVITILQRDGEVLKSLVEGGPVRARIHAKTFWGWRNTLLVTAQIPAAEEPEKFVLFSGHHCSWYLGAMDNGAANATMLEVARILSPRRRELWRSVRFAFWPGHTQGRYAGSTWYFDQFWEELYDNCVLHINVDSTGARGADIYRALSMPEASQFATAAIRDAIGVDAGTERMARAGDQSFWGCGIPAIFGDISQVPLELAANEDMSLFTAAGEGPARQQGGSPWWWHTPEDTIDKIDPEVLRRDTRIYLLATWRAATASILPLRLSVTASKIRCALEAYQHASGARFDLRGLIERARRVEAATFELDRLVERARKQGGGGETARIVNSGLMAIAHALVPAYFSGTERFDQDLALPVPPVPSVANVQRLTDMDPASNEARFLVTDLMRGRNRVAFYLRQALAAANDTIAEIQSALVP